MANTLLFGTPGEVAVHVRHIQARMDGGITRGLRGASFMLLTEVRHMFGEYQQGEGPFPTWAKLAESTLLRKARPSGGLWNTAGSDDNPLIRSGELMRSYTLQVQGDTAIVGSDLPYALLHETGYLTGKGENMVEVPARSTLGIAFLRAEHKMFERWQRSLMYVMTGLSEDGDIIERAFLERDGESGLDEFETDDNEGDYEE